MRNNKDHLVGQLTSDGEDGYGGGVGDDGGDDGDV